MVNHRLPPRPGATFLACLLFWVLAAPVGAEKYYQKVVIVHFKDKGRPPLAGTVVDEVEGEKIQLQWSGGLGWFTFDRIERLELKKPPAEEFRERAEKARSAADWVELARWCGLPEVKLPQERRRCLEEAIRIDPDHPGARKERGEVQGEDKKWILEEEHYKAKGWERLDDGRWVPPEEATRFRAEKAGLEKGLGERSLQHKGVPWAQARTLKSQNYILKCNSTERVAQRYLKVLEALHKAYSEVLKGFEPLYRGPGTVYIFRNRDEFMEFTLQFQGVGGFFSFLDRSVRAYHGSFGPTGNTDMVLAHEATHQFQHRIMKQMLAVPNWLLEGMAVYFGDGTRIRPEKVQLNVIPRDRLHSLQEAISTNRYMPLQRLLVQPRALQAYDHGWGVVFWCLQGQNPRYKFGHKGEGKRIWDQYLRHVATELTGRPSKASLVEEAKYFTDLVLKETKQPSIEKWEEEYKKFIMALPIEPLGKWNQRTWDGWTQVGIRFTVPERFTRVEEKDLRAHFREAAAAVTEGGLRLWLCVDSNPDQDAAQILSSFAAGHFTDREPEEEFREEEVKVVKVNEVFDVAVTAFKGKYARRRESFLSMGAEGGASSGGKPGKKPERKPEKKPDAKALEPPPELRVRLALFTTLDRFYVFCLAGSEAPFSKVEPKFEELLKSVNLNHQLR